MRLCRHRRRSGGTGGLFARLLALLVGLGASTGPAHPYVFETFEFGGAPQTATWPAAARPVTFLLNDRRLELLPNLAPGTAVNPAIEAAMAMWTTPRFRFQLGGTSAATDGALDRRNLITFADTARNRDLAGNVLAYAPHWVTFNGRETQIVEADIVFNPKLPFSSTGVVDAADLQSILTHELGHTLGLDHSGVAAATMFPSTAPGRIDFRTTETDDLIGARVLYQGLEASVGTIVGRVVGANGAGIFGAHVVALDESGAIHSGVISGLDGAYQLLGLPPGPYQLYVEPLDGPMTPASIQSPFYGSRTGAIRRDYRLTFPGGAEGATTVSVQPGETSVVDPIEVGGGAHTLNPRLIAWAEDGRFRYFGEGAVGVRPGRSGLLAVAGEGVGALHPSAFRVGGSGVAIDPDRIARGTLSGGLAFVALEVTVAADARPGARTLFVSTGSEQAAYTGAFQVLTP